nr:MAG TPA: hypothetical protein [Caudoviricetes sp.]
MVYYDKILQKIFCFLGWFYLNVYICEIINFKKNMV